MIISIASGKGGVGKTTTAIALAVELVRMDYSVLLIDGDPNNNATGATIHPEDEPIIGQGNILHVAIDSEPVSDVACRTIFGFDLIPSLKALNSLESRLEGDHTPLYNFCESIRSVDYDFVLIDCPPRNAGISLKFLLWPADIVISPVPLEKWEQEGADDIEEILQSKQWPSWLTRPIHMGLVVKAGKTKTELALRELLPASFLRAVVPDSKKYKRFKERKLPDDDSMKFYRTALDEVLKIVEKSKGRGGKKTRAS